MDEADICVAPTISAQVSFRSELIASIDYSVGSGTDVSSLDGSDDFSTPRRSVAEGSSDGTDNGLELSTLPQYKDSLPCLSPPSVVVCEKYMFNSICMLIQAQILVL